MKFISCKRKYKKKTPTLSVPEVMMIIVMCHISSYKCLKYFYLQEICERRRALFPNVVSTVEAFVCDLLLCHSNGKWWRYDC